MENPTDKCHGLMEHGQHDKFPWLSGDWITVDCKAVSCANNRFNQCTVPSLAVIDEEGRCKGFKIKSPDSNDDNITELKPE